MRTCLKTLTLCALLAASLGSSAPAFAENRDAMVKMSQEAAKLFQEGKFEQAAKRFNDASKESWEPILVKNEMIAWYKAGRCEDAIKAANTYLDRTKSDQIVEQDLQDSHVILFDCHIKAATASLDKGYIDLAEGSIAEATKYTPKEDASASSRLAGINDRLDKKRAELANKGKEGNNPGPKDPQDPIEPKPEEGISGQAIAGYSLLGAGALGLIVTVVYSANESGKLQDRYDELADKGKVYKCESYEGTQRTDCDSLYKDESRAQLVSGIGYGVSGLMLVGGAVLVYLSMQAPEAAPEAPKDDSSVSFFPIAGPGQAGMGMSFSF